MGSAGANRRETCPNCGKFRLAAWHSLNSQRSTDSLRINLKRIDRSQTQQPRQFIECAPRFLEELRIAEIPRRELRAVVSLHPAAKALIGAVVDQHARRYRRELIVIQHHSQPKARRAAAI